MGGTGLGGACSDAFGVWHPLGVRLSCPILQGTDQLLPMLLAMLHPVKQNFPSLSAFLISVMKPDESCLNMLIADSRSNRPPDK